jgi:hypothetical protein
MPSSAAFTASSAALSERALCPRAGSSAAPRYSRSKRRRPARSTAAALARRSTRAPGRERPSSASGANSQARSEGRSRRARSLRRRPGAPPATGLPKRQQHVRQPSPSRACRTPASTCTEASASDIMPARNFAGFFEQGVHGRIVAACGVGQGRAPRGAKHRREARPLTFAGATPNKPGTRAARVMSPPRRECHGCPCCNRAGGCRAGRRGWRVMRVAPYAAWPKPAASPPCTRTRYSLVSPKGPADSGAGPSGVPRHRCLLGASVLA